MAIKSFEEIEVALAAFTSRLDTIDKIIKAGKLGVEMVPVFRCNHSQLYFPVDYVKGWGKDYGIGLGPDPVSEVLDTEYDVAPPAITPDIRSIEQIMHPVRHVRVQVDFDLVEKSEAEKGWAVLVKDDPFMDKRSKIVRTNQLKNPAGRLGLVQAAWAQARKAA